MCARYLGMNWKQSSRRSLGVTKTKSLGVHWRYERRQAAQIQFALKS